MPALGANDDTRLPIRLCPRLVFPIGTVAGTRSWDLHVLLSWILLMRGTMAFADLRAVRVAASRGEKLLAASTGKESVAVVAHAEL